MVGFRQLFDEESATLTYIIGDVAAREAVVIDPVREQVDAVLATLKSMHPDMKLRYIVETHVHADHITGANRLKNETGAHAVVSRHGGAACAEVQIDDGAEIHFGSETLRAIATPGHTAGCVSYLWRDRLFTGDTLLIGGCGRTDFQGGDAGLLYDSIVGKLFSLPGETLVYPGHDYNLRRVSSIEQERLSNPRLAGKSRAEFIAIMQNLNLPRPKRIDEAVPANLRCGDLSLAA